MKLAGLVLATLLLAGCAATASGPAEIAIHEADLGGTFSLHVGDTVKVDLLDRFPVPGSSIVWDAASSDPSILERVSTQRENPSGIMNAQAHYTAVFKAKAAGTAKIEMTGATRCEAMNAAYCQQHGGNVTVNVGA